MKKINNRVGLTDISEKELNTCFKRVSKEVKVLEKDLKHIEDVFKGLDAQERLILFDVLQGMIIDISNTSTFLIIAILEKYKHLTLTTPRTEIQAITSIEESSNVSYIG